MLQTCPSRLSGELRGRAGPPGASEERNDQGPNRPPPGRRHVESLKASGPGYNTRVEAALRKAGFGATKKKPATKKAATKRARAREKASLTTREA